MASGAGGVPNITPALDHASFIVHLHLRIGAVLAVYALDNLLLT